MSAAEVLKSCGRGCNMLLLSIVSGVLAALCAVYPILLLVACNGDLESDDCDVGSGLLTVFILLSILSGFFFCLCMYFAVMTCCMCTSPPEEQAPPPQSSSKLHSVRPAPDHKSSHSHSKHSSSMHRQPGGTPREQLPAFHLQSGSPTGAQSAALGDSDKLHRQPFAEP